MSKPKKPSIRGIPNKVEYPYSVILPKSFGKFLTSLEIEHTLVGEQIVIQFENKTKLSSMLKTLNKTQNDISDIIINGIKRSL